MNHELSLKKRLALSGYYHATLPLRRWQAARRRRLRCAPIAVLFYHRVAPDAPNAWTMPPSVFQRQLRYLQSRFDLISLETAQQRITQGENDRPAVCITFDDGYADNCLHALPLLVKHRIPCTYFVASQHVTTGRPFPHDVAAERPLAPNTPEQIKALADAGIEIGAHTRTHVDLGNIHNPKRLREEVVGSGDDLQRITGRPVRYFAFPFGLHANLNVEAFTMAAQAGYRGVCSAYGGYNLPGGDAFHLQRIHADVQMIRLKNWLTVDPRKLHAIEPFAYRRPANQPTHTKAPVA